MFIEGDVLPDQKVRAIASDSALLLGVLSSQVHVQWALATGGTLEDRPVYNTTRCFEPFPFPDTDTGLTPELVGRIRRLAEQIDAHRKARQTEHAHVTITAMYNVLEKLRMGESLTAKERVTHEEGLVGVLASLHEELDAAVLAAYSCSDLNLPADAGTLLERLVALNVKRVAEEATGAVRWLRRDFQQRQGVQAAINAEDEDREAPAPVAAPAQPLAIRPWPSGLTEQIKAVADVTARVGRSLDVEELAAHFSARGRWRERLPTILDTLVTLGRLRVVPKGRWVDAGR